MVLGRAGQRQILQALGHPLSGLMKGVLGDRATSAAAASLAPRCCSSCCSLPCFGLSGFVVEPPRYAHTPAGWKPPIAFALKFRTCARVCRMDAKTQKERADPPAIVGAAMDLASAEGLDAITLRPWPPGWACPRAGCSLRVGSREAPAESGDRGIRPPLSRRRVRARDAEAQEAWRAWTTSSSAGSYAHAAISRPRPAASTPPVPSRVRRPRGRVA